MSTNTFLKQVILAGALFTAVVMAQTPYDEGQKALREQDWTRAAEQFDQVIEAGGERADASMYWRAHALFKSGRSREAKRQLRALERQYPDSRWLKEAQVLQLEHEATAPVLADAADSSSLDEDLRMFALARLMERDPERALPLVLDMVGSTDSEDVRSDMLFVLGMSEDPQAQEAIARIARDSGNPELQVEAIHMLGVASNGRAMRLLADLYRESGNTQVRQAVIQAHIVGDEPGTLVELLNNEQNPELQREIIRALGVMDATEELNNLYPTLTDHETRVAALQAFFIAGDTKTLRRVLDTEKDPELRKTAIQGIAMEDGPDAVELLESVYEHAGSVQEKAAILDALVMMDDAGGLALKIIRTESDTKLRMGAINVLGVTGATGELAALYADLDDVQLRKAVLESMMIADDTDGLIRVLESETDPDLRATAIQALAVGDEEAAASYLAGIYAGATRREKQSIIESMMIMDDARGLVGLLEKETDPELKREMLQVLSVMDSEEADEYLFKLLENEK